MYDASVIGTSVAGLKKHFNVTHSYSGDYNLQSRGILAAFEQLRGHFSKLDFLELHCWLFRNMLQHLWLEIIAAARPSVRFID
jgi:hypothetical protein